MDTPGDSAELSLFEHRRRAGPLVDVAIAGAGRILWDMRSVPEVRALSAASPDLQRSIVVTLLWRSLSPSGPAEPRFSGLSGDWMASRVLRAMGNRRPPFTRGDVWIILDLVAHGLRHAEATNTFMVIDVIGHAVSAAERVVQQDGLGDLETPIRGVAAALGAYRRDSPTQVAKYRARLMALLQPTSGEGPPRIVIEPEVVSLEDSWGQGWRPLLADLAPEQAALFAHCTLASGVTPSAAWRKRSAELAGADGCSVLLRAMLTDALGSTTVLEPRRVEFDGRVFVTTGPDVADANAVIIRGAMWAASTLREPWVIETLTEMGLRFGTSGGSSNVARDERLGNTAAAILGSLAGPDAIAGLGRMKAKVSNRSVSKQIAKALDAASLAAGISPSELLELAVPTQGLDADRRRVIPIGDHAAVLELDADEVTLTWRAPDGRETARPPAAMAGELAAIAGAKEAAKELRKVLAIERGRIEDLFTEDREWAASDWQARYVDHPLTGTLGRRLIWTARRPDAATPAGTFLPDRDGFIAADGSPVELRLDDRVRLWHPISATEDEIAAWRSRLLETEIRQPFKQAFRELYVLTPAEEQTASYSNRFAAHVLRYPQARALMTARGWGSNFLGPYDGGYHGIAKRDSRSHSIRAEFWHDAIEDELAERWATTPAHCTTDQVRFLRTGRVDDLLPLRDVPPIVFSEAMRDVDLFVSVTSVGADHHWADGGRERGNRFNEYFADYGNQELTGTAVVRRDALERILPGLAIADRVEIRERWLVVRGDLRTYRIHLGSGNIMMEPADTYLCVVPARGGAADRVFLPFDDDPTLFVILSKAFLLARDVKITDPSITSQIRRG